MQRADHPLRRTFLASGARLISAVAAAAALPALLPRAFAQVRLRSDPFLYGVASGSPAADSVVLWTRLDARALDAPAASVPVHWELAHDAQFQRVVHSAQVLATEALAYAVHVETPALEPDRWYHYRFRVGEASSPVGRTRTLPAPDALPARMRVGYASCQKWEDGFFSAWRHMADEAPDLVLFLGDYLYEYPGRNSRIRTPSGGWMLALEDYRNRYAQYKTDPDLQRMHATAPWILTWDDHEVQNDYAGLQAGDSGSTSPEVADFARRRMAAYQAYFEHMPLRASALTQGLAGLLQGAELRLYGSYALGRLAQLLVLDARQYKDPQPCNPPGKTGSSIVNPARCPAWNDATRSLLGAAQEQWLARSLAAPAVQASRWTVLGQQTLLGPRDFGSGAEQRLWNDGWDGYPAARQRLVDALVAQRAPNPVLLGGDVHENWVGHVKQDYTRPDSPAVGVEFCGTSISSNAGRADRSAEQLARNPHFIYANAQQRGYGMAEFTPEHLRVRLRVVDDVARRDAAVSTLAEFRVEAGTPRVQRVT